MGLQQLVDQAPPDVNLVDWNMPIMNGLEFVQQVRAQEAYAAIPIVMVTTEIVMERVTDALAAGANEYLMKPFTAEAIRQKLQLLGLVQNGGA